MPSRGGNLGARRGLQLAGRRIWRRDRFRPDYSRSARAARRRQVPPGRLRLSHYLRASRFGQGACCVLGRAQQLRLTPFASLTKPGRHVYFLPAAGDHGGHGPALPVHGAADEPAHAPPVDVRGGTLCHLKRGLSKTPGTPPAAHAMTCCPLLVQAIRPRARHRRTGNGDRLLRCEHSSRSHSDD